uniref:Large ribosomal subunit protein mL46 n=1 Tax=Cyprinus carpio TaxID=7962 RepID=A0A8C2KGV1_CYPCA
MAAPFSRVYRPLWRIITTSTLNRGVRNVSSSRQQLSAQNVKPAGAASPWALHGAVCVQRLPAVSQDRSPIEEEFMELMHQKDVSSSERCLADSLILLVKKHVGSQKLWLLPQIQWQTGETLRQTAERALASLPGADLTATFLGNAPCGFYKYKYPKDIQKEGSVGAKVFFFKAVLPSHKHLPLEKNSFAWVKKEELQDFLKPEYLKQVRRFIMAL